MNDPIFDVSGRVVLVAGGARGLGLDIAKGLAQRGAHIVLADSLAEEAAEAVTQLDGSGHFSTALDVTDEKSVEDVLQLIRSRVGRLDSLLNSAGIARFAPAVEMSSDDFIQTMAVNATGAFYLSRCAARVMMQQDGGGQIVHLASVS